MKKYYYLHLFNMELEKDGKPRSGNISTAFTSKKLLNEFIKLYKGEFDYYVISNIYIISPYYERFKI